MGMRGMDSHGNEGDGLTWGWTHGEGHMGMRGGAQMGLNSPMDGVRFHC